MLDWWARSGKRRHQKLESLESQLVLSVNFIFPCPTLILSPCSSWLSLLLSHNFTSFFDIYCWNFLSLAMCIFSDFLDVCNLSINVMSAKIIGSTTVFQAFMSYISQCTFPLKEDHDFFCFLTSLKEGVCCRPRPQVL